MSMGGTLQVRLLTFSAQEDRSVEDLELSFQLWIHQSEFRKPRPTHS